MRPHLWHLHEFLDNIATKNVIECHLKELIGNYAKLELIAMPNEHFWLVDCSYGNLEVVIGRNSKVFGRIEKLLRKYDVQGFLILRHNEPEKERRKIFETSKVKNF